jgi:hypothetical protein
VTKAWPKKVFYIDSFVTKGTITDRATVLRFYEFMLSDPVLDIYIQGQYTARPMTTYLLPPTVDYFNNLVEVNPLYREIYNSAYNDALHFPIYQAAYANNLWTFVELINTALKGINPPSC